MKKFGKIFGVAALAVATLTAGAFGLSGCGNKVKVNDIEKYVAQETTDNTMSEGYKFRINMSGALGTDAFEGTMQGTVVFSGEEGSRRLEMALVASTPASQGSPATYAETYVKGDYIHARESATDKFTKISADFADVTNEASDILSEYERMADLTATINQYLIACKQLEGQGLKITKTNKNGVLKYSATCKAADGTFKFVLEYKNDKLTKLSLDYKLTYPTSLVIQMDFAAYTGAVDFPADLDENSEMLPTPEEGEGGEEQLVA